MTPDLIKKVEGLASRLQEPIIADALCIGQIRKRSMPSCPPDLASLFSVSMAEIFPLPTPGGT